jgi:hypothetical protein
MVIRLISVLELIEFHEIFRTILGWSSNLDYIFRVHGQEFHSFRRASRSKTLQDFRLHRQEKFLYVGDAIDRWAWDVRVVDIQLFPRHEVGQKKGQEPSALSWRLGGLLRYYSYVA